MKVYSLHHGLFFNPFSLLVFYRKVGNSQKGINRLSGFLGFLITSHHMEGKNQLHKQTYLLNAPPLNRHF